MRLFTWVLFEWNYYSYVGQLWNSFLFAKRKNIILSNINKYWLNGRLQIITINSIHQTANTFVWSYIKQREPTSIYLVHIKFTLGNIQRLLFATCHFPHITFLIYYRKKKKQTISTKLLRKIYFVTKNIMRILLNLQKKKKLPTTFYLTECFPVKT